MKKYQGQCYCGEVQFEVENEPLFTQYCHCNKCREVASSSNNPADQVGYSFTAAYLTEKFHITHGQGKLESIVRKNARLYSCANCHSLIYGISEDPTRQAGIGINVNNFSFSNDMPSGFSPVRHIWYTNHIVDISDDLPKYKDAPKEQFGSSELYG